MRFTAGDWLVLAVTSAVVEFVAQGSAVVGVVAFFLWGIPLSPTDFPLPAYALATGVNHALLDGLATWLVLRHCAEGIRLAPWLLAIVMGVALKLAVALPVMALSISLQPGDLLSLSGDPGRVMTRWFAVVASAALFFLPPGLLLQRLTGASAWSFVIAGAISVIGLRLAGPALTRLAAPYLSYLTAHLMDYGLIGLILPAAVLSGIYQALTIGVGLFLMARLPRPAVAP
jgi:hypothetical protein